ncbi:MAG TPA: helix-turn-helix domain-containing protein [Cyclobacteriaceae bacterium]|nr:helix-turn-helix domain-containing protein [Cyclobacteriaceae bacterium]HRJ81546.1 helix-turn-helix domain-containing protein [Cyclobacteriaceae bacterium]
MSAILFSLNDKLYLRDPQRTVIGQAIIRVSVEVIDREGFEKLTFRKVADQIESTEATLYRYFENKFRLLQYLSNWYWSILNFNLSFHLNNIQDAEEKLKICLQLLAGNKKSLGLTMLDEKALHRIMISEFDKVFHVSSIDQDYRDGLFSPFKDTCKTLASIIKEINPKYPFPHSLVTTTITAAKQQLYYSKHMPLLSDIKPDAKSANVQLYMFLEGLVFRAIKPKYE